MTTAAAFASIVSLLSAFKNERKNASDKDYQDFLEWLQSYNHDELKSLIEFNSGAIIGVKALLNKNTEELQIQLTAIDEILSSIASNIDGLSEIALSIHPNSEISKQAISVLEQFEQYEATTVLEVQSMGSSKEYIFMDGKSGSLQISEPRFIEDDLQTLSSLGFLRSDYNSQGQPLFKITRNGAKLVNL